MPSLRGLDVVGRTGYDNTNGVATDVVAFMAAPFITKERQTYCRVSYGRSYE
jgi:hypothetical protein